MQHGRLYLCHHSILPSFTLSLRLSVYSCPCASFGFSFLERVMASSIRKMVMAASVANLMDFILLMAGSNTPDFTLFAIFPSSRSNPKYLRASS
mmetsp:Transcript_11370/g.18280  ORF Transcript_11370/g.18280 Transcript_11370/m.18280 type:complete len:94 (+) Transcript_11370:116-397(+)